MTTPLGPSRDGGVWSVALGGRHARLACRDQNRLGGRPDRLSRVAGESVVPAPLLRRVIGREVESQSLTEFWALLEVFEEGRFVIPAVEFFEQERPNELGPRVASPARIPVVRLKTEVSRWVVADEFVDSGVSIMVEPDRCDSPNIFFEMQRVRADRTAVSNRRLALGERGLWDGSGNLRDGKLGSLTLTEQVTLRHRELVRMLSIDTS